MFSAFKKLTVKQENGRAVSPNNVQSMSTNLQKKFAKVILVNEILETAQSPIPSLDLGLGLWT